MALTKTTTQPGQSTWDKILGTFGNLASTAADAYAKIESAKLTERAALASAQPLPVPEMAKNEAPAPWYQAPWVIPAAIGAASLAFIAMLTGGRGRGRRRK